MKINLKILLIVVVALTIGLRFYHINFQSLWFDELYAVTIAAPDQSIDDILLDVKTDFHPPFYYFLLNLLFKYLLYTDLVARLISALVGCASIWLVYLLSRKITGKNTAILIALLLSVFFFHIKYSQEVRMYIFLFTFSVLSTLLLINYTEQKKKLFLALFALVSIANIYCHYYGVLILFSQGIWILHMFIIKRIDKTFFRNSLIAFIITGIAFIPWLPMIFHTGARQHFMELPSVFYFFDYLYVFTGKEPVTTLFILAGLILYVISGIRKIRENGLNQNSFHLLILYSFLAVFVLSYFISFFKPILNKQSTIAGLPFLLIMVMTGYQQLKEKTRFRIVGVVILANLVNLLFINDYYHTTHKENFRQTARLFHKDLNDEKNLMVISQVDKFYNYYFRQNKSTFRAHNPNTFQTRMLPTFPDKILIINAPFTEEKEPQLESTNKLGFQILNPRNLDKIDSIQIFTDDWNEYLMANYELSNTYNDPTKKVPVGYLFVKR